MNSPDKLLIVDDDRAVTKALETVLRSLNFAVWTLRTGEEALASVQTFRYEAVFARYQHARNGRRRDLPAAS